MAKRGGFPGGMPGNMNNLMKLTENAASDGDSRLSLKQRNSLRQQAAEL